jgi:pimeloyl-ACP methyl ester carboxylesterase
MDRLLRPQTRMKQYSITEIVTKDNLILQGIYHEPPHKSGTAILWVHGLTSHFYGDHEIFEKMMELGDNPPAGGGYGFASFNNRGSGMVTGMSKVDPRSPKGSLYVTLGSGIETFTDCIYDIDAGISFLIKQGFKKVILIGQSTGANKVCYYAGSQKDARVAGVILASPISDRLAGAVRDKKLQTNLRRMKKMVEKGKGDFLVNNLIFMPLTPKRYISLYDKNTEEDVFDYGDKNPKLKYFSQIMKPLLVILGEADESADRPVSEIKKVFDERAKSKRYNSTIIANATHGYDGKEKEFAQIIIHWIKENFHK